MTPNAASGVSRQVAITNQRGLHARASAKFVNLASQLPTKIEVEKDGHRVCGTSIMGSPEFAVPSLNALVEAGHEVVAVYSQPPRAAGRGKAERKTAVHAKHLGRVNAPRNASRAPKRRGVR